MPSVLSNRNTERTIFTLLCIIVFFSKTVFSVLPSNLALDGSNWRGQTDTDQIDAQNRNSRGIKEAEAKILESRYIV